MNQQSDCQLLGYLALCVVNSWFFSCKRGLIAIVMYLSINKNLYFPFVFINTFHLITIKCFWQLWRVKIDCNLENASSFQNAESNEGGKNHIRSFWSQYKLLKPCWFKDHCYLTSVIHEIIYSHWKRKKNVLNEELQ